MSETSTSDHTTTDHDLEVKKLEVDKYKAALSYKKFIWGSVIVAIIGIVAPPAFQLATSEAQMKIKSQQTHDEYVQAFLQQGASQDIEIRIRTADYFANVSSPEYKQGWVDYQIFLRKMRDSTLGDIENNESKLDAISDAKDSVTDAIIRELDLEYKQLGYIEPKRSVFQNPRDANNDKSSVNLENVPQFTLTILTKAYPAAAADAQKSRAMSEWIKAMNDAGYSKNMQYFATAFVVEQTGGFRIFEEDFNYSAERLRMVFPNIFPTIQDAQPYANNPEKIANKVYGSRMGNTDAEDGWKFRGRGLIGITGKDNYSMLSKLINVDLVAKPDLINPITGDPAIAAKAAAALVLGYPGVSDYVNSGNFHAFIALVESGRATGLVINLPAYQAALNQLLDTTNPVQ
jgi:predicted chitinase